MYSTIIRRFIIFRTARRKRCRHLSIAHGWLLTQKKKKKKSRFQKNKSRKIDKIQQNLIRKTTEIATVSRILNHGGTDKC